MLIRPLRATDHDFFVAMVQAFYCSPAVAHDLPPDHAERTFALLQRGSPYADCLIAEDDTGSPCAYCLLALTWSNEAGGLCVWIDEIMVQETQRGQQIGSRLLAAVREKYPQAARYRLEVTAENPRAAALYRRLGFVPLPYSSLIIDRPDAPPS